MNINSMNINRLNYTPYSYFAFLIGFVNTDTLKVERAEIYSTNRISHDISRDYFTFQILSIPGGSYSEAYDLIISELADSLSNYKWVVPLLGDVESASVQNRIDELTMETALK